VSSTRLRLLDPLIRRAIESASPTRLRRIAIAAAAAALADQPECPEELDQALALLSSGSMDDQVRTRVCDVAAALDDRYLTLFDDEKPGGQTEGWEEAFRLARAASALCFASHEDPMVAAVEASYEASHALVDDSRLVGIVETAK
jgi:hypothetical protein